jgi:hypothetical protein
MQETEWRRATDDTISPDGAKILNFDVVDRYLVGIADWASRGYLRSHFIYGTPTYRQELGLN